MTILFLAAKYTILKHRKDYNFGMFTDYQYIGLELVSSLIKAKINYSV